MKVRGDIEHVNLKTGERFQRVSGDGESRLESLGLSREDMDTVKRAGGRISELTQDHPETLLTVAEVGKALIMIESGCPEGPERNKRYAAYFQTLSSEQLNIVAVLMREFKPELIPLLPDWLKGVVQ